jgi:hypothetical protein
MSGLLLPIVAGFLAVLFLNVFLLRWIFRVNRAVKLLESIDRSLQYLPAVRDARTRIQGRQAA